MPDPNKDQTGVGASEVSAETFAKLQEQVENLNKGIATYRSEANTWKSQFETTQKELNEIKEVLEAVKVDEDKAEEGDLTEDDVKKFDTWAKKQGFVSKEDLEAERNRVFAEQVKSVEAEAIDSFLKSHPEYNDDEAWKKVQAEFSQYKQPTTREGYSKILNRIHKDLNGDDGEEVGRIKERFDNTKKGRLALGGGFQGSDTSSDRVEEIAKRYPNLSKEQIKNQLKEINELYPKK